MVPLCDGSLLGANYVQVLKIKQLFSTVRILPGQSGALLPPEVQNGHWHMPGGPGLGTLIQSAAPLVLLHPVRVRAERAAARTAAIHFQRYNRTIQTAMSHDLGAEFFGQLLEIDKISDDFEETRAKRTFFKKSLGSATPFVDNKRPSSWSHNMPWHSNVMVVMTKPNHQRRPCRALLRNDCKVSRSGKKKRYD